MAIPPSPPGSSSSAVVVRAPPTEAAPRLSPGERASLRALINALLPPQEEEEERPGGGDAPAADARKKKKKKKPSAEAEASARYWGYDLSSDLAYMEALETAITEKLPDSDRLMTRLVLWALSTPVGTSALLGVPSARPFSEWTRPASQTAAMASLQQSSLPVRKQIFQGFKRLICGVAFSYTAADGRNPLWEAIGYPGAPRSTLVSPNEDARRVVDATGRQAGVQQAVVDHSAIAKIDGDDAASALECDVLIVGSGAGGSVAASVLSRAGYSVVVVDKGPYVPPAETSHLEADAYDRMYEGHGLLTTRDKAVTILAGSTVGGGTTINWSCALPLPASVREEWATSYGLEAFQRGQEYEKALNYVLIKIGALDRSSVKHNQVNLRLQRGCDALGYPWETTGQNLRDTSEPAAGFVCFGDRYGVKNNGVTVFLKDAAKHGCRILDNCQVTRIRMQKQSDGSDGDDADHYLRPCATGAECVLTTSGEEVYVRARKAVVVAAGALHTPCLLQRSGLRNRNIGRHLRLHPVAAVMGFVEPNGSRDPPIDCFLGAPMTTVCNAFESGPSENGFGARIECPSVHPGFLASAVPWTSPRQLKERMQQYRRGVPLIVLQRDSGNEGGTVRLSRDGRTPIVDYKLQEADQKSMEQALVGSLKILIAAGAQTVQTCHIRDSGLTLSEKNTGNNYGQLRLESDEQVQNYLSVVSQQGLKRHEAGLFSAHQMGSCRMSVTPSKGAVDVNGETWECNNLFVMDASTFPTASGVNPMVTVLVIAKMLSTRLALRLRHEDGRPTGMAERVRAQDFLQKRKEMRSVPDSTIERIKRKGSSLSSALLPSQPVPRKILLAAIVLVLFGAVVIGLLFAARQQAPVVPPPATPATSFFSSSITTPKATPSPPPASPKPSPQPKAKTTKTGKKPSLAYESVDSLMEDTPWLDPENASSIWPYSLMWTALFLPIIGAARP